MHNESIVQKHVLNVGKPGEIKEVKSGYAQNFLFPHGHAVELTAQEQRKLQQDLKKDENHRRNMVENRHNLVEILNGKKIEFFLKTGTNNKVYGGIGEKEIIKEIHKKYKVELAKKHVSLMDGHLKKLGKHDVYIKLGKDAMAKMQCEIQAEKE